MYRNRALRAIFGLRKDEMKGHWRKLHNRELQALYCSPDIIRLIKSRSMRWARHVAGMGDKRNSTCIWVGKDTRGNRSDRKTRKKT
jgi:hypothetical protein